MGLMGALQHAADVSTGALLGLPGGTVHVVVAPPEGAPPVANVPALLRYTNDVTAQGRAGAQRTGAIVRLRRANYATKPVPGTQIIRSGEILVAKTVTREALWWKLECARG